MSKLECLQMDDILSNGQTSRRRRASFANQIDTGEENFSKN